MTMPDDYAETRIPLRTSREWREHYEQNALSLLDIPWDAGADLNQAERLAIAASVQGFQAGESSEGRHLYRAAEKYAHESGDDEYLRAIRLFIKEEQRHARDLARFLELNHIPPLKTTFPDRIFRRLRRLVGSLEISIAVLLTAEIIAKVYYAALQSATNSTVLDALCRQILRDEEKHVEFQAEQLARLRVRRRAAAYAGTLGLQRLLLGGTCLVVWLYHRRVFRRGGFTFSQFWRACWLHFNDAFAHTSAARTHLRQAVAPLPGPVSPDAMTPGSLP